MLSTLTVTTPATSLALLTVEELREAAGVTGTAQDVRLTAMGLRIAAAIMTECNIAVGAGGEPTLLAETLTETFRQVCGADCLVLGRRHDVEITSIDVDGEALDAAEYDPDPESGLVHRLCDDVPVKWHARKIVVVYAAGFAADAIPGDLRQAAMEFARSTWLAAGRDPLVKSERVDISDVREVEKQYWVGSVPGQSNEGAVPDIVSGKLTRFRNMAIG